MTIALAPETDADGTRRQFVAASIGAGLILAGCGDDEPDTAGDSRRFRHALGSADVPRRPQRLVTLDPFASLSTALAVGVPVVGSATLPSDDPFPAYLEGPDVEGIESIGFVDPDLEKIVDLRPDLIIGTHDFVEPQYPQLREIAPTVPVPFTHDWKRTSRAIADLLGRPGGMDDAIDEFEARAARFRRRHADLLARTTVTVLRVVSDSLRIHTDQHFQGRVLTEAGVRRPESQHVSAATVRADPTKSFIEVSLERIEELNADVIYNIGTGGGFEGRQNDTLERYSDTPLWRLLDAVRSGRVYEVDSDHWFNVAGPESAELIIDDLERTLIADDRRR